MFCTNCGIKNPEDARFCFSCGKPMVGATAEALSRDGEETPTAVDTGVAVASSAGPASPQEGTSVALPGLPQIGIGSLPDWLRSVLVTGWKQAAMAAAAAGAAILGMGFLIALAIRIAAGENWAEINVVVPFYKLVGLLAYVMARFPIEFQGSFDVFFRVQGSVRGVLSVLFGLAIAGAALTIASRSFARDAGVVDLRGALLQGVKIGIVFAFMALVGSYVFGISGETVSLSPSQGGALWWGFIYGTLFGALGGLWALGRESAHGWVETLPERYRPWGYGLSGAFTGVIYGLLVALFAIIVILVILFVVADDVGQSVSDSVGQGGIWPVVGILVALLVVAPNYVVAMLLFAHGGTYLLSAEALGLPEVALRINYFSFPQFGGVSEGTADIPLGLAPWYVFLLLVIPLIAVTVAAYAAAARADIETPEQVRSHALRVGIPYATLIWLLAASGRSTIGGEAFIEGEVFSGKAVSGIALLGAFFLPLIWGSAGAWVAGNRYVRARSTAPPSPAAPPPIPSAAEVATDHPACAICGAAMKAGDRFCRVCGTQVD